MGLAHLGELFRLDEERIDVHVFGCVGHKPVNALDDEEITEQVAVEGVEEKETAGFKYAGGFLNDKIGVFDMLEEIHGSR